MSELTKADIKTIYNNPDYWNISPYDGTGYSDVYAGIIDLVGQCIGLPIESRWNDFFRCRYTNKQVVEIGCARGWLLKDIRDRGGLIAGVDVSEYVTKLSPVKDFIHVGFIEDGTPFNKDQFDIGFAVENLEHLIDLKAGLKEIHRIIKPNGIFYFSAGLDADENRHINLMSREDWRKTVEEAGFKVMEEETKKFLAHRLAREYGWNSYITRVVK